MAYFIFTITTGGKMPDLPDKGTDILEDVRKDVKEPSMFKVLLHNDDYTTMEFVIEVLMEIFRKPAVEASQIMLKVHNEGMAVVGIFTFEIAKTKVAQVHHKAKEAEYPLRCSYEEA
jgi:ATP-dependent Clp protease adaptor protein ClpS